MTAPDTLRILSYNLYLGADVKPLLETTAASLPAVASRVWAMVQQTDFSARARILAQLMTDHAPDVIALQEAYRWSTMARAPLAHGPPSLVGVQDFLEILVGQLAARGERAGIAVETRASRVQLPTVHPDGSPGLDLLVEDRLAMLLRAGGSSDIAWRLPSEGRFRASLLTQIGGEPFPIARGWTAIDLVVGGVVVRVINVHLEGYDDGSGLSDDNVGLAQVKELLEGPAKRPGPVVLVGDLNVNPGSSLLAALKRAGFVDAWPAGRPGGHTALRTQDLRGGALVDRLDYILCRGNITVDDIAVIGGDDAPRTPTGCWPSDHAGVVATLRIAR